MTLPIDLVLVRHGQSEGNKAKRHKNKRKQVALDNEERMMGGAVTLAL